MNFDDEKMHFWKYHKIESGVVKQFHLDNFPYHPSYTVIKEFPKAFPSGKSAKKNSHHLQQVHHLCQFFCPEDSYTAVFLTIEDLDNHLLGGTHSGAKTSSSNQNWICQTNEEHCNSNTVSRTWNNRLRHLKARVYITSS